jgi:hypothetical protein
MRVDPDEGKMWTLAEYKQRWAAKYAVDDIEAYWHDCCKPADGQGNMADAKWDDVRIDPDEGRIWTLSSYSAHFADDFSHEDIVAYWNVCCKPVPSVDASLVPCPSCEVIIPAPCCPFPAPISLAPEPSEVVDSFLAEASDHMLTDHEDMYFDTTLDSLDLEHLGGKASEELKSSPSAAVAPDAIFTDSPSLSQGVDDITEPGEAEAAVCTDTVFPPFEKASALKSEADVQSPIRARAQFGC